MNKLAPRAAAIIVKDGQIALMRREKEGRLYYVFPGGKQEEGETVEQAAAREVEEELGLQVSVGRLVAQTWYRNREQFYFLCAVTGGLFGSGQGEEMTAPFDPAAGTYLPVWLPVNDLKSYLILPGQVADLVQTAQATGWPAQPLVILEEAV